MDKESKSVERGAPPTMEDVARVVGLHRTTVSLALRNHPRIPEKTRSRVKEAAEKLGYRPHPLVSALMTYRANHRKPTWRGTLGLITSGAHAGLSQEPTAYKMIFQGALARAHELGYDLQPFWVLDPQVSIRKFNTMLRTRNVPGVIVAPLAGRNHVLPAIDWTMLSAVSIGYSLHQPDLHRVTNDYFHSMVTAITECLERGRRRIAYVQSDGCDEKVDYLWRSAFLMQQNVRPEMGRIEPLVTGADATPEMLHEWLRRERPDVVIALPRHLIFRVLNDLRMQDEIWSVSLGRYERDVTGRGIFQNYEKIGSAAVDFLTGMINRGERGIPEQSHILQIKGIWVEI